MPPPPSGMKKKPLEMPPPPAVKPAAADETEASAQSESTQVSSPNATASGEASSPDGVAAQPIEKAAEPAVAAAPKPASAPTVESRGGLPKWTFFASAAGTVLAGAGAATFLYTRYDLEKELRTTLANEPAVGAINEERIHSLAQSATEAGNRANLMLGVTGGLAALSAVSFFITDWSDGRPKVAALPLLSEGGTGFVVSGWF